MNANSTVPAKKYGYSDFLRDYLHCSEDELKKNSNKPEQGIETITAGDKDKLLDRISRLQRRVRKQAQKRRLANQKKQSIEKHIAEQCFKRGSGEQKRVLHNAFLNFLRDYRRTHRELRPDETMKRSARAWVRMSDEEKAKYRRQNKTPPVSKLHISSHNLNKVQTLQ